MAHGCLPWRIVFGIFLEKWYISDRTGSKRRFE